MTDATAGFGQAWSASLRRGSEDELRGWLGFALGLCDAADEVARAHFRRDLIIETKPDRTFVTEADKAIERLVRERIADTYPDHGVLGEEYGDSRAGTSVAWIVDPIDGTHNFMRGVPLFGTLLAVGRDGELQVGVMSAPALHSRWLAFRGGGAWARDLDGERPIAVSRVSNLADSQVLYGSATENRRSGLMPGFDAVIADAWRDRGFGDFWGYALVAEGAAEAMLEVGMNAWDLAAPQVIIEEAGGRVTDVDGRRRIDAPSFVGSNGHLHEEILRRLRS